MSERDLALDKVQKAMKKNSDDIKAMTLNATWCEVNIKSYESKLAHQEKLFKDIENKFKLQINRAITNAKKTHEILDGLLEEKEALHLELKAASYYGMVLCEYCNKYFTPQGISRHKTACSMKPNIKVVEKHKEEIKDHKEDLEARKAALQKELEELEKTAKD